MQKNQLQALLIVYLTLTLFSSELLAQCTTSYNFAWDNGAGVGETWLPDDVSRTYTNIGGSGVNATLVLTDPDGQNCDTGNPSTFADYTETTGGYGNDVLTWQMTSTNSNQEVTFTFTFTESIFLDDFAIFDLDNNGDDPNFLGESFQDELSVTASKGGVDVPVTLMQHPSATASIVIISGQSAKSNYVEGVSGNVGDTDPNGAFVVSTSTGIDRLVLSYSNGPEDDGESDDHAIKFPGFTFCKAPADTDLDGIADIVDLDDDNDGILDEIETCGAVSGGGNVDINVEIQLDGFPGETSWTLSDGASTVASGSGYSTANAFIDLTYNLPAGDYSFNILDTYGDGLTDIGGYYQIKVDGSIVVGPVNTTFSNNTNPFTAGIAKFACLSGDPAGDADNDGTVNYADSDFCTLNANGVCTSLDTDGDGIPDFLDLDSDEDGCFDANEAGHSETVDGLGVIDGAFGDNGFDNDLEDVDTGAAAANYTVENTSGSGSADYQDSGESSACTPPTDTDNDGTPDLVDVDDDNDGILDTDEGYCSDPCTPRDTDGDSVPDYLDLDADNDGIADIIEAGGADDDGDGRVPYPTSSDPTTMVDVDGNGLADIYDVGEGGTAISNPDTDGDGLADAIDLDADNDGLADIVEAGGADDNGDGFVDDYDPGDPSIPSAFDNTDNDGWSPLYDGDAANDGTTTTVGDGTNMFATTDSNDDGIPESYSNGDTDGDGRLDHLDLDADNDGIADIVEAGGSDDNGDGFVDNYDPASPNTFDTTDGDGWSSYYDGDAANDGSATMTGDGDVLIETFDSNDDGYPNSYLTGDFDKDGHLNQLDLDADNDGIVDIVESLGTDINGDGMVDDYNPVLPNTFDNGDNDGWSPTYDGDAANDGATTTTGDGTSLVTTDDTNNDGFPNDYILGDAENDDHPNFLDIDADDDGIVDNVEGQSTADYTLPIVGASADTDNDGINDAYDSSIGSFGGSGVDSDGGTATGEAYDLDNDNTPDFLDEDTDDDNIPDIQEAWDNLMDGDSRADVVIVTCDGIDVDNDGLLDCFDSDISNPTVTSYVIPINDNGHESGSTTGDNPTSGSTPDDIFPDNGGMNTEADWRDTPIDCAIPQVYYAISEQAAVTNTDYEYNPVTKLHEDGTSSKVVRATAYCEPGADGWYYYYNPLEPDNYLFAIKDNVSSPNLVPMYKLVDYIEIKVADNPSVRYVHGAGETTLVMERDWNVAFKGTPTPGSSFDVKFYFRPEEMAALDAATTNVVNNATNPVRSALKWFKKPDGLSVSDIQYDGITNMTDITSNDPVGVDETTNGNTDGSSGTTGNGRNYVEFVGLTSFSGGTAMTSVAYSALPVELSSFSGKTLDCQNHISWSTSSEKDFSHFEVQQSTNGRDFVSIKQIAAQGGVTAQVYQFIDEKIERLNYYRLKMVDVDQSFEYSEVIVLSADCNLLDADFTVFPNPVTTSKGYLNLQFEHKGKQAVEQTFMITDILSRTLKVVPVAVEAGENSIQLDISDLPAGTYFLNLNLSNQKMVSKKFMVIDQ
ncbi:MAG: T9SS type A sorting domain-containing protein [Saprospiraceae bacterium]